MEIPVELLAVILAATLALFARMGRRIARLEITLAEIGSRLPLNHSTDTERFIKRHHRST